MDFEFTLNNNLSSLEKFLDADVLCFKGAIYNDVDYYIKRIIESNNNKKDTLYIILTTNGGSINPVERIAKIFRHHYKFVNFIIPDYAYSAGTILCMSGDNIYMNYYSVLGPIDPQVQNKDGKLVPALGYLDKINELIEKCVKRQLTEVEFIILKEFDLAELKYYEQAKDLTIDMLKGWLSKYKFKDWQHHSDGREVTEEDKKNRAEEIAKKLSDNKRWKSHSRGIDMQTLSDELRLKIEDIDKDYQLKDILYNYYNEFRNYTKYCNINIFIHYNNQIISM